MVPYLQRLCGKRDLKAASENDIFVHSIMLIYSKIPSNFFIPFSIFHYFGTLTFINIIVRGSELRHRKKTTNYGYAFVGNSQMLRWTSTDDRRWYSELQQRTLFVRRKVYFLRNCAVSTPFRVSPQNDKRILF